MNELQTTRLNLRKLDSGDAAFIVELLNDPDFIKNIADRGVRSNEDALQYLSKGPLQSYKLNEFGMYCVVKRDTLTRIGVCGLIKRPGLEDVDIGFAFLPAFRKLGYALESSLAVVDQAKNRFKLKKLVAITLPVNESSIQILEKIGMAFERKVLMPGETEEVLLYAQDLTRR